MHLRIIETVDIKQSKILPPFNNRNGYVWLETKRKYAIWKPRRIGKDDIKRDIKENRMERRGLHLAA